MDIKDVLDSVISADGQAIREENMNILTQENVLSSDQAERIAKIVHRMKEAMEEKMHESKAFQSEEINDLLYQAVKQCVETRRQNYSLSSYASGFGEGVWTCLKEILLTPVEFIAVGDMQNDLYDPYYRLDPEVREIYEKACNDIMTKKVEPIKNIGPQLKKSVVKCVRLIGLGHMQVELNEPCFLLDPEVRKSLSKTCDDLIIDELFPNFHELSGEQRGAIIGEDIVDLALTIDMARNTVKLVNRPSRFNLGKVKPPTTAEISALARRKYVRLQSNYWLTLPTHKAAQRIFSFGENYIRPTTLLHPSLIGESSLFTNAYLEGRLFGYNKLGRGVLEGLTEAERQIVGTLIKEGKSVQVIPRAKEALFRGLFSTSPDFFVDGIAVVEVKTLGNVHRLGKRIRSGATQAFASPSLYSKKVIIDMMNSPNSFFEIQGVLNRCYSPLVDVEVWTREGIATLRRGQLNLPLTPIVVEGALLGSHSLSRIFSPDEENSGEGGTISEKAALKSIFQTDVNPSGKSSGSKEKIDPNPSQQGNKKNTPASAFLPTDKLSFFKASRRQAFGFPKMGSSFDASNPNPALFPPLTTTLFFTPFEEWAKQSLFSPSFDSPALSSSKQGSSNSIENASSTDEKANPPALPALESLRQDESDEENSGGGGVIGGRAALKNSSQIDVDPSGGSNRRGGTSSGGQVDPNPPQQGGSKKSKLASAFLPTHKLPFFKECRRQAFGFPKIGSAFDTSDPDSDSLPSLTKTTTTFCTPFQNWTRPSLFSPSFDSPNPFSFEKRSFHITENISPEKKEAKPTPPARKPVKSTVHSTTSLQTAPKTGADYSAFSLPTFSSIHDPFRLSTGMFHSSLRHRGLTECNYTLPTRSRLFNTFSPFRRHCGGVEMETGIIRNWNEDIANLTETEQRFLLPAIDGKPPFTQEELQQILRELAIGIFLHDAVPCVDICFNSESSLVPLLHPIYENTLVGNVIGMLDYMLKAMIYGAFFEQKFIQEWESHPTFDQSFLREKLVDLHQLCEEQLGKPFFPLCQLIRKLCHEEGISTPLFFNRSISEDSHSFRIIATQKKIEKEDDLFIVGGDFEVRYSLRFGADYLEQKKEYEQQYGEEFPEYRCIDKAHKKMCKQIKSIMPQLPFCRDLFAMLKTINFFCYYFTTLKSVQKTPFFTPITAKKQSPFPSLFPPLPMRRVDYLPCHITLNQLYPILSVTEQQAIGNSVDAFPFVAITEEKRAELKRILQNGLKQHLKNTHPSLSFSLASSCFFEKEAESFLQALCMQREIQSLIQRMEEIRSEKEQQENALSQAKEEEEQKRGERRVKLAQLNNQHRKMEFCFTKRTKEIARTFSHLPNVVKAIVEQHAESFATLPYEFSFPKEIKYDFSDRDKEFKQQVFGGCLMQLHPLSIVTHSKESGVWDKYRSELSQIDFETYFPPSDENRKTHSHFLFKLNVVDFPAIDDRDYGWLNDTLIYRGKRMTEVEKAVVDAIVTENDAAFRKAIKNAALCWDASDREGKQLIHFAASCRTSSFLQAILPHYSSLHVFDQFDCSPLHYAAMGGSVDNLTVLLQSDSTLLDKRNKSGINALYVAIQHNQLDAVRYLIGRGEEINCHNRSDISALHCSLELESDEIALLLLSHSSLVVDPKTDHSTPLCLACTRGWLSVVKKMVERKVDVNRSMEKATRTEEHQKRPLFLAIEERQQEIALFLIEQPTIELNATLPSGETALHMAAKQGNVDIVRALIGRQASLALLDKKKNSVVMAAIYSGNFALVTYLIEKARFVKISAPTVECLLDVTNLEGKNAVQIASELGLYDIVQLLVEYGARRLSERDFFHQICKNAPLDYFLRYIKKHSPPVSLLSSALAEGIDRMNGGIMTLLLGKGADPSFRHSGGWTLYHYAAKRDFNGLFRSRPIPLHSLAPLDDGRTVAYIAAQYGSIQVLRWMLKNDLEDKAHCANQCFDRHLLYAAIDEGQTESARLIIEKVLDANISLDNHGTRAMHIAVKKDDKEMMSLLRSFGGRFDVEDNNKHSPIHYAIKMERMKALRYITDPSLELTFPSFFLFAVEHGKKEICDLFLSHGFPLEYRDPSSGETAFLHAIRHDQIDMVAYLHKKGANINAQDKRGCNAIHLAALLGKNDILKLVLALHIDRERKAKNGATALHLAVYKGDIEAVEILLQHRFSPHELSEDGFSSFSLAIGRPDIEAVLKEGKRALFHFVDQLQRAVEENNEQRFFDLKAEIPSDAELPFTLSGKRERVSLLHFIYQSGRLSLFERLSQKSSLFNIKKKGAFLRLIVQVGCSIAKQAGLHPAIRDEEGNSPIHLFCNAKINKSRTAFNQIEQAIDWIGEVNGENDRRETPLFFAIRSNKAEWVHLLLKKGANPNHLDADFVSPLFLALEQNNKMLLCELIAFGADVNQRCLKNKQTALHKATQLNITEFVIFLLSHGAHPNLPDKHGILPFHLAAQNGNAHLLSFFAAKGVNLLERDYSGRSIVHHAVLSGKKETLSFFKDWQIPIDLPTENHFKTPKKQILGQTPLHLAAKCGDLNMVKALLALGAEIKKIDDDERGTLFFAVQSRSQQLLKLMEEYQLMQDDNQVKTALQAAIRNNCIHHIHLLYSLGVPLEMNIAGGYSGLHLASLHQQPQSTAFFLSRGVEADVKMGNAKETPIEIAVKAGRVTNAKLLLSQGNIDVQQKNNNGDTLLHLACQSKSLPLVALLLPFGVPLDECNAQGKTALHLAVETQYDDIARLLILCGASKKITALENKNSIVSLLQKGSVRRKQFKFWLAERKKSKQQKESVLHLAVRFCDGQLIPYLCRICDVNVQDKEGNTPLHLAASKKQKQTVRHLLGAGANITAKNRAGITPLEFITLQEKTEELESFFSWFHSYITSKKSSDLCEESINAIQMGNKEKLIEKIHEGIALRSKTDSLLHIAFNAEQETICRRFLQNP